MQSNSLMYNPNKEIRDREFPIKIGKFSVKYYTYWLISVVELTTIMKKLLALLFSIFFLSSPSVFADNIDLYELSIKYPHSPTSESHN